MSSPARSRATTVRQKSSKKSRPEKSARTVISKASIIKNSRQNSKGNKSRNSSKSTKKSVLDSKQQKLSIKLQHVLSKNMIKMTDNHI